MSESSAHPSVIAAVEKLDTMGELPASEHVEIYEAVHRALQDALAEAARAPSTQHDAAVRTANDVTTIDGIHGVGAE